MRPELNESKIRVRVHDENSQRRRGGILGNHSFHERIPYISSLGNPSRNPVEISFDNSFRNPLGNSFGRMAVLNSVFFEPQIEPLPLIPQYFSFEDEIMSIIQQQTLLASQAQELHKNDNVELDIKFRNFREGDEKDACAICQDFFANNDKITLLEKCSHNFHYGCLINWGKYKPECPVCRAKISVKG